MNLDFAQLPHDSIVTARFAVCLRQEGSSPLQFFVSRYRCGRLAESCKYFEIFVCNFAATVYSRFLHERERELSEPEFLHQMGNSFSSIRDTDRLKCRLLLPTVKVVLQKRLATVPGNRLARSVAQPDQFVPIGGIVRLPGVV